MHSQVSSSVTCAKYGGASIIVAIFFLGFNLIGLPAYPSAYDRFLLLVSMGSDVLVVWYAWNWS
ncbi:MAG: hypothetical protein ACE5QF_01440 [Thermoplasmata archaeon]